MLVGNQLPILLISFRRYSHCETARWESVTNPLDKLSLHVHINNANVGNQLPILLISFAGSNNAFGTELGISYQSS